MNLQDLKKYRAIPLGWLKAIGYILFLMMGAAAPFLLLHFRNLPAYSPGRFLWALGFALYGPFAGAFLLFLFFSIIYRDVPPWLWPINQLCDYWRRNVVGYVLDAHSRKEYVDPHVSIIGPRDQWQYCPKCDELNSGKAYFRVPLGGWFKNRRNRPHVIWNRQASGTHNFFPDSNNLLKASLVDHDYSANPSVKISDSKGDKVTLPIWTLLSIFDNKWWSDVRYIVIQLNDALGRVKDGRDAAKKEAEVLRAERNVAYDRIEETIQHIDATRRFGASKEGGKIRQWLTDELLKLLPADDQRRKSYKSPPNVKTATNEKDT